jgi:hypothetical protein
MTDDSPDRTIAHDRDVDEYRHPYPEFPYEERVAAFAASLEEADLDGAVLPNYIDCTYFTGSGQPMVFYVPAGRPDEARAFVRRAMGFAEQENGLPSEQVQSAGRSALGEDVDWSLIHT